METKTKEPLPVLPTIAYEMPYPYLFGTAMSLLIANGCTAAVEYLERLRAELMGVAS